jgi:WSC domain
MCSFPCPGNSAETCGAGNYLTTYAKTGTLTSTSSAPSIYGYLGCYTEATIGRALVSVAYADDGMTVEMCASECSGFTMFGVEYQRECYCGNTLGAGSAETSELECKYSCMGNSSESCGGDSRLNLYKFGATSIVTTTETTFTRQGCYTEGTGIRALTGKAYFNDSMTVEACATACEGYTWFGVEYGRECYCGNTINRGSVIADDSNCSFNCPGDSTEKCGAGNFLDVKAL